MLKKKFAILAIAAGSALSAAAAMPEITKVVSLSDLRKTSPIDLSQQYTEIPNTAVSVEACTFDRHIATIHGVILSNKTNEQAAQLGGLPVRKFNRDLQIAFANALVHYNANELEQDGFLPGNFKNFGEVFTDVTRATKAGTNNEIIMVYMPRLAKVEPTVNMNCPTVLKK